MLHEFHTPPYGGGNQFLLALREEFGRRRIRVDVGRVGPDTKVVLFNSHHFDAARLRRIDRTRVRMIHRVDGPIGVYRGRDDGTDRRIWAANHELADATIFQSRYSLDKHDELGLRFTAPQIIPNAADPSIFFPASARSKREKLRVIASAWSDNPRKGGPAYHWLDSQLDRGRYEFTFVGRIDVPLRHSRVIEAQPSQALADLLRDHDVYLTASEDDPCSNALIEALSCGLPAVYRRSGGHPELVKSAGLGFDRQDEIPELLDTIRDDYDGFRARIQVPKIADVAAEYLRVMGLS
jgi:glycosyltransferase involved in cell wall biosynthesis